MSLVFPLPSGLDLFASYCVIFPSHKSVRKMYCFSTIRQPITKLVLNSAMTEVSCLLLVWIFDKAQKFEEAHTQVHKEDPQEFVQIVESDS